MANTRESLGDELISSLGAGDKVVTAVHQAISMYFGHLNQLRDPSRQVRHPIPDRDLQAAIREMGRDLIFALRMMQVKGDVCQLAIMSIRAWCANNNAAIPRFAD